MLADAFTFFNETEVLALRLNLLSPIVDRFVIVEATKTFQGKDRQLVFPQIKHQFRQFSDKLCYVAVDDMPSGTDPWAREHHQRRCIGRGLSDFTDADCVLVSDVDEIPDPRVLHDAVQLDHYTVNAFQQRLFYYYANCACDQLSNLPWTAMTKYGPNFDAQNVRNIIVETQSRILAGHPNDSQVRLLPKAGWHFSFLGGVARIVQKLESYSHNEFNNDCFKNSENLLKHINNKTDILGRQLTFTRLDVNDESFPSGMAPQLRKWPHLLME